MRPGTYTKPDAKEVEELLGEHLACIAEGGYLALEWRYCRWERLLRFSIDKFAKVECP